MGKVDTNKLAKKIWSSIMKDFSDRRGIKNLFDPHCVDGISKEVLKEIKKVNVEQIETILNRGINDQPKPKPS